MGTDVLFSGLLPAFGGRCFQQAGERVGGVVTDDQPFLFGPALPGCLAFLRRHDPSDGKVKSAPAGDRTRTTEWSPACKAGVFASYTTGAKKEALNVGAGGGSKPQPAPHSFGPSSAAHYLFS